MVQCHNKIKNCNITMPKIYNNVYIIISLTLKILHCKYVSRETSSSKYFIEKYA